MRTVRWCQRVPRVPVQFLPYRRRCAVAVIPACRERMVQNAPNIQESAVDNSYLTPTEFTTHEHACKKALKAINGLIRY
ncbi:MAG TPA: hypothetical protein VFZ38_12915, partial [Vicinamibacterales bacterium]